MTHLDNFFNIVKGLAVSVWGLTIMDIFAFIDIDAFTSIDNSIKTLMAILGALYFAISLPFRVVKLVHEKRIQNIELEKKKEELEKIKRENDADEQKLKELLKSFNNEN